MDVQEITQSWFCCMFYILNTRNAKLIWTLFSKVKKKVSILLGASSIPGHITQQDPSVFWHHWDDVEVLSAFLFLCSLRSLVWILRCIFCLGSMWAVCKRRKLCFADDHGEMGVDGRLLLIIRELMVPSLEGGLDGNIFCMFSFHLE